MVEKIVLKSSGYSRNIINSLSGKHGGSSNLLKIIKSERCNDDYERNIE